MRSVQRLIRFLKQEGHLLGFGLLLAFFSNFGQTFLVSLFVPGIRAEFELSNTYFGALYSAATLASAFLLPWTGALLDRVRLPRFTVGVVFLVSASAAVVGSAGALPILFLGLVGLRLGGQGLASHTAYTVMARYYQARRGTALALCGLGFPLGEALLPVLMVAMIGAVGWRMGWLAVSGAALVLFLPALLLLLRRSGRSMDPAEALREASDGPSPENPGSRAMGKTRDRASAMSGGEAPEGRTPGGGISEGVHPKGARAGSASAGNGERGNGGPRNGRPLDGGPWTRKDVLGDPRFWMVLPAALLPPFWATALFLYQVEIGASRGWSAGLMASAFTVFALARIATSLATGHAVDRVSAQRLFPFSALPLGGAMALLLFVDARWGAFAFMAAIGLSVGLGSTMKPALWAELYGTRHLGAIKAMVSTLMVVSTAASPLLAGWALDRVGGLELLLSGGVVSVLVGTTLALPLLREPLRSG